MAIKTYKNIILPVALILFFFACEDSKINVKPKVLGNKGINLNVTDTANSETFKFNFAYRDNTAASPLDTFIYMQGAADTKTTINATCNAAGTNCLCEFFTGGTGDTLVHTATSAQMSYDSTGNYLRCQYSGSTAIASITYVRLRNLSSTTYSSKYALKTSLTAAEIIGDELSMNKLRTVSRYLCQFNFLQKIGTTTSSFDCSSQSTCNSVNSNDFCLLITNYPFFLYSDNLTNNLADKMSDKLYNAGVTNKVCNLQIKQLDCTGAAGLPVKHFGLYAEQVGVFQTPVSMTPKPDVPASNYGFAAGSSTFLGNTVCPPGLTPMIFFRATPDPTTLTPAHNIPTNLTASDVSAPTSTLTPITFAKYYDGDCNGTLCDKVPDQVDPASVNNASYTTAYSSTGETTFCVIPASILP